MANYCENKLIVTGNNKELQRFKLKIRGSDENIIDFNNTVPLPIELENNIDSSTAEEQKKKNIEKYGAPDWYYWRLQNWGCKWNPYEHQTLIESLKSLRYEFATAWSPPIEWVIKTSELFPTLKFTIKYREEGIGFKGYSIISNGTVEEEKSSNTIN